MATDVPDYSELDEVFDIFPNKGNPHLFDLRSDISWKHRLRPFRRYTVRQFYFWHKTIYHRGPDWKWLPKLVSHDNQTDRVGRRHFLHNCSITPRAARKLDFGPLIDDRAQKIIVPKTRWLRRTKAFVNAHWWETLLAIIGIVVSIWLYILTLSP